MIAKSFLQLLKQINIDDDYPDTSIRALAIASRFSDNLKADREVVLASVLDGSNYEALNYAEENLRNDLADELDVPVFLDLSWEGGCK